jgi:hypothetical protein
MNGNLITTLIQTIGQFFGKGKKPPTPSSKTAQAPRVAAPTAPPQAPPTTTNTYSSPQGTTTVSQPQSINAVITDVGPSQLGNEQFKLTINGHLQQNPVTGGNYFYSVDDAKAAMDNVYSNPNFNPGSNPNYTLTFAAQNPNGGPVGFLTREYDINTGGFGKVLASSQNGDQPWFNNGGSPQSASAPSVPNYVTVTGNSVFNPETGQTVTITNPTELANYTNRVNSAIDIGDKNLSGLSPGDTTTINGVTYHMNQESRFQIINPNTGQLIPGSDTSDYMFSPRYAALSGSGLVPPQQLFPLTQVGTTSTITLPPSPNNLSPNTFIGTDNKIYASTQTSIPSNASVDENGNVTSSTGSYLGYKVDDTTYNRYLGNNNTNLLPGASSDTSGHITGTTTGWDPKLTRRAA